ncbi:MAG: ribosome silencing factor [Rhodoferax sp.]|nr:ribosome silencing factor [Rhodoferax sp.]
MTTKISAKSAKPVAVKTPAKTVPKAVAKAVAKAMLNPAMKAALSPAPKLPVKAASTAADKKDVQKLQRAVVDGLEDVKAQEIVVFDTEHLSSLFERVIIASGSSNRQTKALAASVVDAVRDAGFQKPRVEGEDNGEWIIVDCGAVVVHVMQPNIRTYYNLEELWGEKPVRLKLGAPKPVLAKVARLPAAPTQPSRAAKPESSLRRSSAAKKGVAAAFPSKAQLKKQQEGNTFDAKKVAANAGRKRAGGQKAVETSAKPKVKTLVVNAPSKPAAKPVARAARSAPAKKSTRPAARKA